MRNYNKSLFKMNHIENKAMIGAFAVGLILQIFVTEVPFLTVVFETVRLSMGEWFSLILISMIPLLSHEVIVGFKKIKHK